MGKGSGPGSNTATKQARVSSTGAEGDGQDGQATNTCLFQFTERLVGSSTASVKVGDTVALVRNAANPNQLDIFIGSAGFGSYSGQDLQRILKCMDEKYSYTGTADSVTAVGSGVEIACTIRGYSYEQSSTAV
jgi:hypothetical protein